MSSLSSPRTPSSKQWDQAYAKVMVVSKSYKTGVFSDSHDQGILHRSKKNEGALEKKIRLQML